MAGETILVIDDSAALREISRKALERKGFRVTTAGNAAAPLLTPELDGYDLIVVDGDLEGLDGLRMAREFKMDTKRCRIPILLTVPPSARPASIEQGACDGYIAKPFNADQLAQKVDSLLEDVKTRAMCDEALRKRAEAYIEAFADTSIQAALKKEQDKLCEESTGIVMNFVENTISSEIERKVIELGTAKEEELVLQTVTQVAQATLDKIAQELVQEAAEAILEQTTEKAVNKQIARQLPSSVREKVKEVVENTLPREINNRLQKATADLAPQLSEQILQMVTSVTDKVIPKVARERIPEMLESQVNSTAGRIVPGLVNQQVPRQVATLVTRQVEPIIQGATSRLQRKARHSLILMIFLWLLTGGGLGYFAWIFHQKIEDLHPTTPPVEAPANPNANTDGEG